MALMNPNAPVGRVVWPRVAIGNFLFIYSGQSVRVVVVVVCTKPAHKSRYMFVHFRVSRFPSERHNNMLVYEWRIGNNPGFLVVALVKRDGQRPHLFFHGLFELCAATIRFNPRFLHVVGIYQPGDGYGRNLC